MQIKRLPGVTGAAMVVAAGALLAIPASASAAAHPAAKHPSGTSVSAKPGSALAGTRVTLSATVKSSGSTPTGTVSFTAGSRKLCSARLSHGSTHCTTTFPAAGAYTVKGAYSGDSTHAGSSGTTHVTAGKAATSTAVAVSTGTAYPGQKVTLTGTVSSRSPLTPTGRVTFRNGGATLCTGTLSKGKASCRYARTATGPYTVTGFYAGDAAHFASSGKSGTVTVAKLKTATQITGINPGSVRAGDPATVTVKVTTPAGTPAASGTVKVAPTNVAAPVPASYSGTAKLTDGTGSCKVTPPNPSFGIIVYRATYNGDTAHSRSVSTTKELIVPDTTTTSVAFSPATGAVGTKETLTATVVNEADSDISPDTGGTGTVTFTVNGNAVCTDVQLSYSKTTGNTATCSFTPMKPGSYAVKAAYSGDSLNLPSSGTRTLSVP